MLVASLVVKGLRLFTFVTSCCEVTQPFMPDVTLKLVGFTTRSVTGTDQMDGRDTRWGCFGFVRVEIMQQTQLHTG